MRSPRQLIAYLCISLSTLLGLPAQAQINPDQTLGTETSVVTPNIDIRGGQATLIEGGAVREFNVFHSFSDFNVGELERVYFESPLGVDSIFSRVTGANPSNIFGTLGVAGPASLYFINPNGIVWGADATLDVAGSLAFTTGEAIALGPRLFSATRPSQSQLLAIKTNTSFFNYLANNLTANSRDIILRGDLKPGGDLVLAGNNIRTNGALAPGEGIRLMAKDTVQFQGVASRVRTGAFSGVEASGSGIGRDIVIEATNLAVLAGAEINSATAGKGNAGNITLNINEAVQFAGQHPDSGKSSLATSGVELGGEGQGGDLVINANSLEVVDGAQLRSVVAGKGNAGDVILNIAGLARFAAGATPEKQLSGIIADITGEGQGGNIVLNIGRLEVLEGAQFSTDLSGAGNAGGTDLSGAGNAGNITAVVRGTAQFVGDRTATTRTGGVFSRVDAQGKGQGGNISIVAENLDVLSGARISSELSGAGNAGNILLTMGGTVRFSGNNAVGVSGAFSQVASDGEGQAGNVRIVATNLAVLDGAQLTASTAGRGNAGNLILEISEQAQFAGRSAIDGAAGGVFSRVLPNSGEQSDDLPNSGGQSGDINIRAANLDLSDGAQINATVQGLGNAGRIVLIVDETARLEGGLVASADDSGVFSRVEKNGEGQSGTIRLSAGNLTVLNGAQLSTSMAGRGNAGSVVIAVRDLARFEGRGEVDTLSAQPLTSGVFSSVASTGEGQGGKVEISAGSLSLTRGALIATELESGGNAGNITIEVRDLASFSGRGSGASSRAMPEAAGGSGDVVVRANNILVDGGAQIAASNAGRGTAGNLFLRAADRLWVQDGTIATNSAVGAGGQIRIEGELVVLRGDSDIQTFVNNGGNSGGNIAIASKALILLEDSDLFAFSLDGQGGKIDLSQTVLFSQNPQPVSDGLSRSDLLALEGNSRVDINATGGTQSGQVSINNANFVENDLTELTDNIVNTDALLANSCIARRVDNNGSLTVSGRDRLPQLSNEVSSQQYSVGTVQPIPVADNAAASFKEADRVQEPNGIYHLADGR